MHQSLAGGKGSLQFAGYHRALSMAGILFGKFLRHPGPEQEAVNEFLNGGQVLGGQLDQLLKLLQELQVVDVDLAAPGSVFEDEIVGGDAEGL